VWARLLRMDVVIRPLETADRPEAARVLDDAVGAGFWGFDGPGEDLSFVALTGARLAGVALCRLEPAGDPDAREAFAAGATKVPGSSVLHVRAVAVAPDARRAGIARRMLARAEAEAAGRGAEAAYLFAWLPAERPEPAAVPLYLATGYVPGRDIEDFYAAGSVASGADCPYCGAPPCRCSARPFTKALPPA
jgi:GNAT superfamily N-acetyltransferase